MAKLTDAEVLKELSTMLNWGYESGALTRYFRFKDAIDAFAFISQIGILQEQANHHASILSEGKFVTVTLRTEDDGGVSQKDVDLARKLSERARPTTL